MKNWHETAIGRRHAIEAARALHARGVARIDFVYAHSSGESRFHGSKAFDEDGRMLSDDVLEGWSENVALAVPGWQTERMCSYSPRHHQVVTVGSLRWKEEEDRDPSPVPVLDTAYESVVAALTWHSALPRDAIQGFVCAPQVSVRAAAAANPALPADLQERLSADRSGFVRRALACNPGLAPSLVWPLRMAGHQYELSVNPTSFPEVLSALVPDDPPALERSLKQGNGTPCQCALEHPGFPLDRLQRLSEERPDNVVIAAALAGRPDLPSEAAAILVQHPDRDVRNALCQALPPNLTLAMLFDLFARQERFDHHAQFALARYDFSSDRGRRELEELLTNQGDLVAKQIHGLLAQNPTISPEQLARLPLDPWVGGRLMENPGTPPDLLARLIQDPLLAEGVAPRSLERARERLLAQLTPAERALEIARWAVSSAWSERALAARQVDASAVTLLGLLSLDGLFDESDDDRLEREKVWEALAVNPSLPIGALHERSTEAMREHAARGRKDPADLAALASDPAISVRRALAGNGGTPGDVLERLADDAAPSVREAVLENLAAPRRRLLRGPLGDTMGEEAPFGD